MVEHIDDCCFWKPILMRESAEVLLNSPCARCTGQKEYQTLCQKYTSTKAVMGQLCSWYVAKEQGSVHASVYCEECAGVKPGCDYYLSCEDWSPHNDVAFPELTSIILGLNQLENI